MNDPTKQPTQTPPTTTSHRARWFTTMDDGRFRCDVCPRECTLRSGQRGFCYVRAADDDGMTLETYGRSSGFCLDPIEKKPLFHFLPGTSVLSFGTAGCNLGCRFCQNWDLSKARSDDRLQAPVTPDQIADAAVDAGAHSVAFTYNDPTIFAEYAIDVAKAVRARGLKAVAVTNGYIQGEARRAFYDVMDAANIDLKGFTEAFYEKVCLGGLEAVKDTLRYVKHETDCHLEVTTLLIPGHNDGDDELLALSRFVADELGVDVPLHFTAFHPDHQLIDADPTPPQTLQRARRIARGAGLRHVYVGNVMDIEGESTACPGCGERLIERDRYVVRRYALKDGRCPRCGTGIAGVFTDRAGDFGRRRIPLRVVA
jgi:pyruvate formate lyase activating enzyme